MRLTSFVSLSVALLSLLNEAGAIPIESQPALGALDALAAQALANIKADLDSRPQKRSGNGCKVQNASVRREWNFLSKKERKSYVDAIICLQNLPSRTDSTFAPGARNRYDDFVITHMNQTLTIHATANFLSWHRYYIWAFEKALRTECGYKGYLPYWNWALTAHDIVGSPMFDGSDSSLGTNGEYIPNKPDLTFVGTNFTIPAGSGGGCVMSGPFSNYTVNVGPGMQYTYNPRCLKRDLNQLIAETWTNAAEIVDLIVNYNDIVSFQDRMQGDFPNNFLGVHAGGHNTLSGDPGSDIFASPGEPAFWVHHGMIDRVWWIWQNLNRSQRLYAIGGTRTFLNFPPSENGTIYDLIDMGINGDAFEIREFMDTLDGELCYIYL